jgi:hypothetical protein
MFQQGTELKKILKIVVKSSSFVIFKLKKNTHTSPREMNEKDSERERERERVRTKQKKVQITVPHSVE